MFTQTRIAAGVILVIIIAGLLSFTGCDDRNEAELPKDVFTHQATYTAGSVIKHVAVDGNYAAIAASVSGTRVLDVSDVDAITEVFAYETPNFVGSQWVGISSGLGMVSTFLNSSDPYFGISAVFNFLNGDTIGGMGFTGPLADLALIPGTESSVQSFYLWATDRAGDDGLVGTRYCYNEEQAKWTTVGCPFVPPTYTPARDNARGFGIKDNLFAIAIDEDGIHIEEPLTNTRVSNLYTPGIAYDCAWYGDYIVVADRYFVTMVNAANVDTPVVVTSLIIDGADRLNSVEVSGSYAALMDEYDGVYIIDLSEPADPKMVQQIKLNEPTSIAADGNRLYITDELAGLLIYTR
ncbi:hypothetical protein KKC97_09330 [bacterium]|nr:hypothetical protein [bacterium]MBU1637853.1 hypothetical protein [bacterium]MBU1919516.1 hypothetical protein [bacterium]